MYDQPAERRNALGQFLRSRRERTRAADYGFPQGRRRTAGLRREEVALLAGISPTWYTYLEQGRDVRASPETIENLAEVLRLDPDERGYLLVLAQAQPALVVDERHPDNIEVIVRLVDDQSGPCYATTSASDMVAWNASAAKMYTDFGLLPPARRNMLWWMFNAPEARERLVDWTDEARDLLARMRASMGRTRDEFGEQVRHEAVQDVLREHPQARVWWDAMEVRGHTQRVRRLRQPDGFTHSYHVVPMFDNSGLDYLIVFHQPVDVPSDVEPD